MTGSITVVSGPPCAGKTTYVTDNCKDGDVVVDLDAIASALGSGSCARGVALAVRAAAIDHILSGIDADAWIIDTNLRPDSLDRYTRAGAAFVALDPGMDVCLARAVDRPEGTADVIRGWYAARSESKRYQALREAALKLADQFPDRLGEILAAVSVAVSCSGAERLLP